MLRLAVIMSLVCSVSLQQVAYRPGECLKGDRHKELSCPEPESPDYEACYQWSEETCCTAEFTKQLAGATVVNIDGFHWSRCDPPLSKQCEEYFKRVECFYRCSPNVAHWALEQYDSALSGLPVCADFCDNWFDACASDLTCAVNWITDWTYFNGINQCKDDAVCQNFSNAYGDGAGLCNTLWGDSFVYTEEELDDTNRTCLSLWWPANETNPNDMAIRNIFGDQVDTVTAPVCASTSNAGRNEAAASVLLALVCMGVSALANSIL